MVEFKGTLIRGGAGGLKSAGPTMTKYYSEYCIFGDECVCVHAASVLV